MAFYLLVVLHGVQCSEKLAEFWDHYAQSTVLYQTSRQLQASMEKAYGSLIRVNHAEVANKGQSTLFITVD